jgi:hypothetical protein
MSDTSMWGSDALEEALGCLWFIPPGLRFEWGERDVPGLQNIQRGGGGAGA